MFDRFTDNARKTMGLSRQESQRFNHDYIAPEHLLLGLVDPGAESSATKALANLEVAPRDLRRMTEDRIEMGAAPVTMGQIPFTPAAKRVLERAVEEASNLGHNYIGTEHLLLGLIRDDGLAGKVLADARIRLGDAREQVLTVLGEEPKPRVSAALVLAPDSSTVTQHVRPALAEAGITRVHVLNPDSQDCEGEVLESICRLVGLAIVVGPVTPGTAYAAGLCRGAATLTIVFSEKPAELPHSLQALPVITTPAKLEQFVRDSM